MTRLFLLLSFIMLVPSAAVAHDITEVPSYTVGDVTVTTEIVFNSTPREAWQGAEALAVCLAQALHRRDKTGTYALTGYADPYGMKYIARITLTDGADMTAHYNVRTMNRTNEQVKAGSHSRQEASKMLAKDVSGARSSLSSICERLTPYVHPED